MNVSILTKEFRNIEMTATDIGVMSSCIHLWNAVLDEDSCYDIFRQFCENIIYKKPDPDSLAISQNEYYLSIPQKEIDSIFIHERRE